MSGRVAIRLMSARRFVPLWAAQVLGAFNDNLCRYALIALVAYQGISVFGFDRPTMSAMGANAFTVAIFLFSALAGQFADKYDRMSIMRRMKALEILLMLMAAIGFVFQMPGLLLLTLFLTGVQSAFFIPARNTAMAVLLERRELVAGNALVSGAVNVAILLGAIGGSALVGEAWGPVVIGATLLVVAVIGWIAVIPGPPVPPSDAALKIRWNIVFETVRVLGFALRQPEVFRPMLGVAWFWMMGAAVITGLPLFTRDVLGAEPLVLSLFQLIFTVGAALGALTCGVLSRGGDALSFSFVGALGLVAFSVDIALFTAGRAPAEDGTLTSVAMFFAAEENLRVMISIAGAAFSGGLFLVPFQAMIQHRAAPERRGRILAANGILNGGAGTLGPLILVVISVFSLPMQTVFWFVAAGSAFAAAFILQRLTLRLRRPR